MISAHVEPITTGLDITITRLQREICTLPPHSVKRGKLQAHYSDLLTLRRNLAKDLNGG